MPLRAALRAAARGGVRVRAAGDERLVDGGLLLYVVEDVQLALARASANLNYTGEGEGAGRDGAPAFRRTPCRG